MKDSKALYAMLKFGDRNYKRLESKKLKQVITDIMTTKNFKKYTPFIFIVLMNLLTLPAFGASKDVTMQVGETQTLYLPSSVTSLNLKSVNFYSNGISYIQV